MPLPITIITPCYNENVTALKFLANLEEVLKTVPEHFRVVVVNDSSTDNTLDLLRSFSFSSPDVELVILNLKFNVGHQSAIYQGLFWHLQRVLQPLRE